MCAKCSDVVDRLYKWHSVTFQACIVRAFSQKSLSNGVDVRSVVCMQSYSPFYEQCSSICPCRLQHENLPILEFLCPYNLHECYPSIFSSAFLFLGIRVCVATQSYIRQPVFVHPGHMSKISELPTLYYTDNVSFNGEFLQDVYIPSTMIPCYSTNLPENCHLKYSQLLLCSPFMVQVSELYSIIDCTNLLLQSILLAIWCCITC